MHEICKELLDNLFKEYVEQGNYHAHEALKLLVLSGYMNTTILAYALKRNEIVALKEIGYENLNEPKMVSPDDVFKRISESVHVKSIEPKTRKIILFNLRKNIKRTFQELYYAGRLINNPKQLSIMKSKFSDLANDLRYSHFEIKNKQDGVHLIIKGPTKKSEIIRFVKDSWDGKIGMKSIKKAHEEYFNEDGFNKKNKIQKEFWRDYQIHSYYKKSINKVKERRNKGETIDAYALTAVWAESEFKKDNFDTGTIKRIVHTIDKQLELL